jgi:hypothetical protein
MPRFGPDISHFQKEQNVDLAKAKPHVDFVFLKATDGPTVVDETFRTRWQKLAQLAIPRGAYHFARPGDAAAQAAHFVKVVKTQNGFRAGDVAIIDVENPRQQPHLWDGTAPTALRAFVDRFVKDVRQGLPVQTVVLYTGIPFWNSNFGHPPKLPANCIGWLSRYRAAGPYGGNFPRPAAWPDPPDIWQFTDGQPGEGKPKPRNIPGIGTVDTSEMTEACFQRLFEGDDMTTDQLLDALESPRGKAILRGIVALELATVIRGDKDTPDGGTHPHNLRSINLTVKEIKDKLPG